MKKTELLKSNKVILIFMILFFTVSAKITTAQIAHVSNIALTDLNIDPLLEDPGSFVGDIIYAQNFVFVYAENKVFVYNATTNEYIKTVSLTFGQQTDNENYGKFSPLFFNTRMHVNEAQFMTYNEDADILYALGSDLRIYAIKVHPTPSNIIVDFVIDRSSEIDYLAPLHGLAILKYSNNRLYCVIGGRNILKANYFIGAFHNRAVYFTIYNMNNTNGTMIQQIYDELYYLNDDGTNDYSNSIMDIEINEVTFGTGINSYNIFYLARNERVEIYKVAGSTVTNLSIDPNYPNLKIDLDFYKVGKMLYINQTDINKILVFPYRTPTDNVEPDEDYPVHFYEIDGTDPTVSGWGTNNHTIVAPHKRILDAAFLPGQDDLIVCYSNDDLNNIGAASNTDIAIYSYNSTDDNFGSAATQYLNTNDAPGENPLGLNRPLKLHAKDNYALMSKKDEIIKIYRSNGEYTFNADEPLVSRESNYFYTGAIYNDKFFILNLAKNGIEVLNQYSHMESIRTGFQCLNITHNPIANKLYYYNKLNVYGNGMYLYNLNNETVEDFIEIEKPIGDVIYNPYQDHMLVSENAVTENEAIIYIIEDNALSETTINLGSGTHHPKEMFIAPNGNLYIAVNMRNDTPKIIVIDASDYNNIIDTYTISELSDPTSYFSIYNTDFCYNPYNRNVYATITTNNTTIPSQENSESFSSLDPYYPVLNSTLEYNSDIPFEFKGVLIEINENDYNTLLPNSTQTTFSGPREIICATPDNAPDGYKGKLYINADKLTIYDCASEEFEDEIDIDFNDITYNSNQNMIYGFTDGDYFDENSNENKKSWRIADIYSVDESGSNTKLYTHNGQLASIFTNPHNGLLYLQSKVDQTRLGCVPMSLIEIDPIDAQAGIISESLENKSHYVELDKNGDYHFHNYNLTTPFIDPYQNRFYLPNGGHSNVSVVEFTPNEPLFLNSGEGDYDWISIPRLNRVNGDPIVDDVLSNHIFPDDYQQASELINVPPGAIDEAESKYTGFLWPQALNLTNIYSTRGYKLKLKYDPQPQIKWLEMEGDVIASNTPITLHGFRDNWVGYFLYKEQDIFDALGLVTNYLLKIESEEWCCVYRGPYTRDPNDPEVQRGWDCSDEVHNIDYGDMVVLTTDYLPANYNYTWQGSGQRIEGQLRPETDYFSYTETADYTPVFVLLDSTENPSELATYVNDSCVGACIVLPGDTMVGIQAYLEGQPNDSITFETWYNTKSIARKKINSYAVYNPDNQQYEKRSILISENKEYYMVSFKKSEIPNIKNYNDESNFWIYPNPVENNLHIEYELENECEASIEIYNIFGLNVALVIKGKQLRGKQKLVWDLTGYNGEKLPAGVYTIRLKAGSKTITKKVVIN